MHPSSRTDAERRALAAKPGLFLLLAGAIVLVVGWGMGVDIVTRVVPGLASMKVNTALGVAALGGATMAHLARMVPDIKATLADEEERLGADIVMKGLIGPLTLIAENAGVEGAVVVDRVQEEDWEMGYNAMDDEYVNMLDAGVIDPAKVTRCALENASSIAGMVLTTQAVMCEDAPAAGAAPTLNGMTGMPGM